MRDERAAAGLHHLPGRGSDPVRRPSQLLPAVLRHDDDRQDSDRRLGVEPVRCVR